MAWTKEQEEAINLDGQNIIVSAGAGSGKTAVLTARVIRKLKSGVHINQLLILTFTNAAAYEMKKRIRKAIMNDDSLKEELNYIDSAFITTFDAFALSIVKKYHTKLNITNNIKITDQVIIDIAKGKILDDIFDKNYLLLDRKFTRFINNFCLKNDKEVKKYILDIYSKIELKYDKESYLKNYLDLEFTDDKISSMCSLFLDLLKEKQRNISNLIIELDNYFDNDFVLKVKDNFRALLEADSYDDFKNSINYNSITLPKNSPIQGKVIKQNIFSIANDIRDLCIYDSVDSMKEEILSTRSDVSVIIDILMELDKRLDSYKRDQDIYNFTDISRLAIKVVLLNNDIKEELTNSFSEIMIDEYQDTSDTQELFISLISNNNVYMVGDIKQSIYRFRNANPYIFKNKYDSYSKLQNGVKIDLLKNFRSRKEVLENINLLFDLFMDDNIGGADYRVSHRMQFGNTLYINEGLTEQNYNLDVITYDTNNLDNLSKDEEEAFIIANDIKNKIDNKYKIFDKDNSILRDCQYSDFVILLDRSKNFDLYKKIFQYLKIPLTIVKDESLSKDYDILVIRNLLRLLICIKNSNFDLEFKYSFISVCRSFLYRTDDYEIYNYFINNNYCDTDLYKKCLLLADSIDYITLSGLMRLIFDEFDYDNKLINIGNVKYYRVREEYIYNLCCDYEKSGKSIYDFVSYLNEIFDNNYDLKFNVNTDSLNSCKIMTIHKSKGLEFPICYFASLYSQFNMSELKEKILFDNKYGIIVPKVDNYYKDTIIKTLLKNRLKKEEISERIRLFYVALTRAKEKMIFVIPNIEEELENVNFVPDYLREGYNSFLSIIKSIYSTLLPYVIKTDVLGSKDYLIRSDSFNDLLEFDENKIVVDPINIDSNEILDNHFSKDDIHLIDKDERELLNMGIKVHSILEEIDFKNYDLSLYDIDSYWKSKIINFINSKLIQDNINSKMYKEYEFVDYIDDSFYHGIIDLLIEGDDSIIIVDYKLKNIDDSLYDNQLNGYRNYIRNKTNKKVSCYLYSIMNECYRLVDEE